MLLEIWLFGGFRLRWGGRSVDTVKPGKTQLLLSYLLLHRDRVLARSRVAAVFWPDSTEEQARTNLRRELHALRAALPEPDRHVLVDARQIGWRSDAEIWLDVAEFEHAPECCGGDLLPGYYEDWVLEHRDRLAYRYQQCMQRRLDQHESRGEWSEAIESARRLIELDPANEGAHQRLIHLHLAAGDRAAAQRAQKDCIRKLRDELDVDPSVATLELLREISVPPPTAPEQPPLVGRQRELALARRWTAGQFLLLVGEPGIGKTRLLHELAGPAALWGRGFEAEQSRPFGPWLDALRGRADLLRADATHRTRDVLFDPMVEWLRRHSPIVLVLDDLQWFDEASLSLLHYASRLLGGRGGVKLAGAARAAEIERNAPLQELLRSLRRSDQLLEVRPEPLAADEVAELVAWAAPGRCAGEVTVRAGGNPLFALELARSNEVGLEACIGERLDRLSGVAREIVSWAAALGRSFAPELLESTLRRGPLELLPALEELEAHRVLLPVSSGYDFGHDVVRELAYARLSVPRRRLIHREIARVLEQRPDSWADLPRHAALAEDHALAVRACIAAALQSLRLLAFGEASAFARRGMEHASRLPAGPQSVACKLELLRAELLAGVSVQRSGELRTELEALLVAAAGEASLQSAAYEALSSLAHDLHHDADVETYSLRLAEVAHQSPAGEAARWLAHSASCLASVGRDMPRAEALLKEAEELAARCHLQLVDLPLTRGLVEQHRGRIPEARTALESALALARRQQEPWWWAQCLVGLGRLLVEIGDEQSVLPLASELEQVAPALGEGSEMAFAQGLRALAGDGCVEDALMALERVDARRMVAFVAREAARRACGPGTTRALASRALRAARDVRQPDEITLAWTLLIEATADAKQARQELIALRRESRVWQLGHAAQTALERVIRRCGGRKERSAVCP